MRPAVGTVAYRVAPSGSQSVFVNRYTGDQASVCTPGFKQKWSQRPILGGLAQVFVEVSLAADELHDFRLEMIRATVAT
jgi:hypothetical protein